MAVGRRIREARKRAGMTLHALATASELSKGFLSQVERGLAVPSLGSLERIGAALNLSAAELIAAGPSSEQSGSWAAAAPVRVWRERTTEAPGADRLHVLGAEGGTRLIRVRLSPNAALIGAAAESRSPDPVFCICQSGTIRVEGAEEAARVGGGEIAAFPASQGYRLTNPLARASSLVLVLPRELSLPRIEPSSKISTGADPALTASAADTGPFRLVAMRAARRARQIGGR